jgi:hypothetical protein
MDIRQKMVDIKLKKIDEEYALPRWAYSNSEWNRYLFSRANIVKGNNV